MSHRQGILIALLLAGGAASAAPPPPPWEDMLADAKRVFARQRDNTVLKKMVRANDPRMSSRRTAVDLVPEVFQDVDCIYQGKRFGQLERETMTLHYERNLGGWTMVGYSWGERETMRAGKMPPQPPMPTDREILDAVRGGMREWRVRSSDIEKVQVSGKPGFSWLDDAPTAGYLVPVKVSVRDVVDRSAQYGARTQTRFLCDLRVQLALEDQVTWTMQGTVPDCAEAGCSLARLCKDTWVGKGPAVTKGTAPPVEERPARRASARDVQEEPPPPPPRRRAPPVAEEEPPPSRKAPAARTPPPPAATGQPSSDGACPPGQFVTLGTNDHCCWKNQMWSSASRKCVGSPVCPKGYKSSGTDCVGGR
jgi:hypothetical protein